MDRLELIRELSQANDKKIVLVVMDGLGGLPGADGRTELEAAKTPGLDELAAASSLGLSRPLPPGLTPGSGPAHLALFGYDPFTFMMGRGVLDTLGAGGELEHGNVVARINFATVGPDNLITDRRAGRIATEKSLPLCRKLDGMRLEDVTVNVIPVKEYRAGAIFRGPDLSGAGLNDTDPQQTGKEPLPVAAPGPAQEKAARIANAFVARARELLRDDAPANLVLLRGFSEFKAYPSFGDVYKLKAAAIAAYPMYRGVAKLLGLEVLDAGDTPETELAALEKHWGDYDFFFFHYKKTDSMGEDGNFAGKVEVIEHFDELLPRILALKPDVLAITGDHSTPCAIKSHSWHPVPFLLHSPWVRAEGVPGFGERACGHGRLGQFDALDVMPLLLANAQKLLKYGA